MIKIETVYDENLKKIRLKNPIDISLSQQDYQSIQAITKKNFGGFYYANRIEISQGIVKGLSLSNLNLYELPSEIKELRQLSSLDISENHLKPNDLLIILNSTSLERLNCSRNKLESLPENIGDLKSLKYLESQFNGLNQLPETIGDLISLEELDVCYNELTTFPESIKNLKSLKILNAGQNPITYMPQGIKTLPSLKHINVFHDRLDKPSLELLKELKNKGVSVA